MTYRSSPSFAHGVPLGSPSFPSADDHGGGGGCRAAALPLLGGGTAFLHAGDRAYDPRAAGPSLGIGT